MPDDVDWEAVARSQLASEANDRSRDLKAAAWKLGEAFKNDSVSDEEVRAYRQAIERLATLIEEEIVARSPGVEAYDSGFPYLVDTGDAADLLDLTVAQVNEVNHGATAMITPGDAQAVANGEHLTVTTDAGIEVSLTSVDTTGEESE